MLYACPDCDDLGQQTDLCQECDGKGHVTVELGAQGRTNEIDERRLEKGSPVLKWDGKRH